MVYRMESRCRCQSLSPRLLINHTKSHGNPGLDSARHCLICGSKQCVVHTHKSHRQKRGAEMGWRDPEYILIHVLDVSFRGVIDGLGPGKLAFDHLTMAKLTPFFRSQPWYHVSTKTVLPNISLIVESKLVSDRSNQTDLSRCAEPCSFLPLFGIDSPHARSRQDDATSITRLEVCGGEV
jgi:hypothetical protein